MRAFITRGNLIWATLLAVPVTLASIGRLMYGGRPLLLFVPILFLCMMYIVGAITAWGHCAGMRGVLTDRRTLLLGAGIAAALALLALPVQVFWLDPLRRIIIPVGVQEMAFPSTLGGRMSLLLWCAGVQTMFFSAAPMAVAARLTRRRDIAFAACLLVRAYVAYRITSSWGVTGGISLLIGLAVVNTAVTCALFARFGLVPACVFNACLELHVFIAYGQAT